MCVERAGLKVECYIIAGVGGVLQKEREGFFISGSGGDMNFPFSLLACQYGLIKTELSTPVD